MEKSCIDLLNKKQKIEDGVVQIFKDNSLSVAEIIAYCKSLAKKFIIDMTSMVLSDWFYSLLFQYLNFKDIAKFDLAVCNRKLRPQWLQSLGKYTSSASFQVFYNVNWSDSFISWIIQRNLYFDELAIEQGYHRISYDGMCRLAQHCSNLNALKLSYYSNIKDCERFQCLASGCNKLKRLEILKHSPLNDSEYALLGACVHLESIKIVIVGYILDSLPIKIKQFLKDKQKLKALEIQYNCGSDFLLELGVNCPQLEHLSIDSLVQTSAADIEHFLQVCRYLKTLELWFPFGEGSSITTDELMVSLGKHCPLLESLVLKDSRKLSTSFVLATVSETSWKSFAQGCPLLKTFHIDFTRIPSVGVKHLVYHCSKLADISLRLCGISDDVLVELSKSKMLKRLDFSNAYKITDTDIDVLVKGNGSQLEYLDISGCSLITDASLKSFGEHCPNLHSLFINDLDDGKNYTRMTSAGLKQLVEKCKKLVDYDSNLDYNDDEDEDDEDDDGI